MSETSYIATEPQLHRIYLKGVETALDRMVDWCDEIAAQAALTPSQMHLLEALRRQLLGGKAAVACEMAGAADATG